mmetsp:Transcript_11006/g.37466  ORF Transcript_11006/g.37466 Transcript_11006/m.37466 type:complete len:445 (+) Transcript_11006:242-1576(+)
MLDDNGGTLAPAVVPGLGATWCPHSSKAASSCHPALFQVELQGSHRGCRGCHSCFLPLPPLLVRGREPIDGIAKGEIGQLAPIHAHELLGGQRGDGLLSEMRGHVRGSGEAEAKELHAPHAAWTYTMEDIVIEQGDVRLSLVNAPKDAGPNGAAGTAVGRLGGRLARSDEVPDGEDAHLGRDAAMAHDREQGQRLLADEGRIGAQGRGQGLVGHGSPGGHGRHSLWDAAPVAAARAVGAPQELLHRPEVLVRSRRRGVELLRCAGSRDLRQPVPWHGSPHLDQTAWDCVVALRACEGRPAAGELQGHVVAPRLQRHLDHREAHRRALRERCHRHPAPEPSGTMEGCCVHGEACTDPGLHHVRVAEDEGAVEHRGGRRRPVPRDGDQSRAEQRRLARLRDDVRKARALGLRKVAAALTGEDLHHGQVVRPEGGLEELPAEDGREG